MTDFATVTHLRQVDPGLFAADIPDGWQQGRGAFGGLLVALMARACERSEDDEERRLRSLTAELCAPVVVGRVGIRAETLRRGNNVTTTAVRLIQGGEVVGHLVGVLARRRDDARRLLGLAPPVASPWADTPVTHLPANLAPTFTQWLEFRNDGPLPFSGAAEAGSSGWIRLSAPGAIRDVAEIAALIDAWWPAHFAIEAHPRPIATIAFSLEVVADLASVPRDAPLYHRGRVLAARDGYLVEQRELWTPQGDLVALNTQTVALIK